MAALKSITAPSPAISSEELARAYELISKAQELRKLFAIINRLVDTEEEDYQDNEVQYVAAHGEQLAADLGDALAGFTIDLTHGKGVAHG